MSVTRDRDRSGVRQSTSRDRDRGLSCVLTPLSLSSNLYLRSHNYMYCLYCVYKFHSLQTPLSQDATLSTLSSSTDYPVLHRTWRYRTKFSRRLGRPTAALGSCIMSHVSVVTCLGSRLLLTLAAHRYTRAARGHGACSIRITYMLQY